MKITTAVYPSKPDSSPEESFLNIIHTEYDVGVDFGISSFYHLYSIRAISKNENNSDTEVMLDFESSEEMVNYLSEKIPDSLKSKLINKWVKEMI